MRTNKSLHAVWNKKYSISGNCGHIHTVRYELVFKFLQQFSVYMYAFQKKLIILSLSPLLWIPCYHWYGVGTTSYPTHHGWNMLGKPMPVIIHPINIYKCHVNIMEWYMYLGCWLPTSCLRGAFRFELRCAVGFPTHCLSQLMTVMCPLNSGIVWQIKLTVVL